MHVSADELKKRMDSARELISVGSTYRHRKGDLYQVRGIVLLEGTADPAVLYFKQGVPDVEWVRELNDFLEKFELL